MKKLLLALTVLLALCLILSSCKPIAEPNKEEIPPAGDQTTPTDQADPTTGDDQLGEQPSSEGLTFTSNGNGTCCVSGIGTCTDTDIVIPKKSPAGDRVTSIEGYVAGYTGFNNCSTITSVVIPNSVTRIGDCAFLGCFSLTSIEIPDSVTSIGNYAFWGCFNLQYTVYDNAKYLGNAGNPYLALIEATNTSIPSCTIHPDAKVIANAAFDDCSSLTSVTIPDSVTSIGYSAFDNCSSLTSVTIPDSVTGIDSYAFRGCSSLTSITIPGGITSIGNMAFYQCSSLTSILIPNSVTSIGQEALCGCSALTSITVADGNPVYHSAGNCLIKTETGTLIAGCNTSIIPTDGSITCIEHDAFYGCSSLTSVAIPNSVTSMGHAFNNCTSLTSITVADGNPVYHSAGNCLIHTASKILIAGCRTSVIPTDGSVTSIGDSAFRGCSELTSITIPDSVTSIGYSAFDDCSSLTSVTIPNSVTSIRTLAFSGCSTLTSITVADGNPVYHSAGNCLIETETGTLIAGCKASMIPDDGSVTSIEYGAFYGCSSLTSVTIPDGVTSIGDLAFDDCSSLTSVTIPNSVTSIGAWAFDGCSALTSITYTGTIAEWNVVAKESGWDDGTGFYVVHCTDGDVSK